MAAELLAATTTTTQQTKGHASDFISLNMMVDLLYADDSEEEDDILEEGITALLAIESSRYLMKRVQIPKNRALIGELLPQYDDYRFRRTVRMGRAQFQKVLHLIQDHPVFNTSSCNQYPVSVQLLLVLNRFGTFGNSAGIMAMARNFGVGDGGTLNLFTKRVITALLSVETKFISWPNDAERKNIGHYMITKQLPQCIGYVDGTHIGLARAPKDDAISYFNRKGFYSLNVQIICDPFKKVRAYHVGQPGKVHDAKVYSLMNMCISPQQYFSGDEFIIGDSAYKLTSTVITPFRKIYGHTRLHEKFNHHLSKKRITIEHVNGILKSRFASLNGLRMIINRNEGHQFACEWIVACLVLYNMLFDEDPWGDQDFDVELQIGNALEQDQCEEQDESNGKRKRDDLLAYFAAIL